MEFYIDSANMEEIQQAVKLAILDGVTTNPTILSKQELEPKEILVNIDQIVSGKVWYQVSSETAEEMVREAFEICEVLQKPVIKLPMGMEALNACKSLSEQGIETNMTLVFSVPQALLAAKAGAAYVSPYVGRVNDTGGSGYQLIEKIVIAFEKQQFETKVIGASLRGSHDIAEMAVLGAKAVTMPYKVLMQLLQHPMTEIGRKQFNDDWKKLQERLKTL